MMYSKKIKFSHLVLLASLLIAGCDNSLTQVEDPINKAALDDQTSSDPVKFSELQEMTDFSNMEQGDYTGRFFILSKEEKLPDNIERKVQEAGGEIVNSFPEIGVAIAVSRSRDFYSKVQNIQELESIIPDVVLQYSQEGEVKEAEFKGSERLLNASESGTPFNYKDALYDGIQWAPRAVDAPKAWDAGFTGKGIRVAIVDGGFAADHIDLAPNFDLESSRSFFPPVDDFTVDARWFSPATEVAGVIAGAGIGMVGIAPRATIIGVKSMHSGYGAVEWIVEGIIYSATSKEKGGAGAHIIHVPSDYPYNLRDFRGPEKEIRKNFQEYKKIYDRAIKYAHRNGVTVISSPGNRSINYDDEKEWLQFPEANPHVLIISPTGPSGWALGNTNFSQPAYYTNYGKSLVDFAAPGGTDALYRIEGNQSICTIEGTNFTMTNSCYAFDGILTTTRGFYGNSYGFIFGGAMASSVATGIVALMMEANGGRMSPAQVKAKLSQTSLDFGKPGKDEYYGNGFINAAKAVGLE